MVKYFCERRMPMTKTYIVIDLKTFYASVECVERGLDPFQTNLVVADPNKCESTICLAITPKMKKMGIKNRCRLFQIPKDIKYIIAKPRMEKYIEYSANIYSIYLKYISKDDIHVYSVDEAFLDVTKYLNLYELDAPSLAKMIMDDIFTTYHITATAGIGTNMFLAKVALDIEAKHSPNNIGFIDEDIFIKKYSKYKPITDFWQIGNGIAARLQKIGIYDLEGIRNTSENLLFDEFGVNAQLLIDHANGIEPCTISDIKAYVPENRSMTQGQVLPCGYYKHNSEIIVKEMVELACLDLVAKELVVSTISISFGYVNKNIKGTGGSIKTPICTNSYTLLIPYFIELFNKHCLSNEEIRKVNIAFNELKSEDNEIYDLFTDYEKVIKERNLNKQINMIKQKYGKNSVLKAMDLEDNATTIERNKLIGGHNAK